MKYLTDQQFDRVLDTLVLMTLMISMAYVLIYGHFEVIFK